MQVPTVVSPLCCTGLAQHQCQGGKDPAGGCSLVRLLCFLLNPSVWHMVGTQQDLLTSGPT